MNYCRKKDKFLWKEMQETWLKEDILGKQIFEKNFEEYEFDENEEWTLSDYEQSPLSQIIFAEILSSYLGNYEFSTNRYYTFFYNKKSQHGFRILFDLMNNPKYNIGKITTYKYRKIGNFTFYPGKSLNKSLQFIHREKDERWDEMLEYLRENWSSINNLPILEFNNYIKVSCQHIYYKCVYEKIREYNFKECNIDELYQEINNIVDTLGMNAEFVSLDSKDIIEELINIRGKILVNRFEKATKKYN